MGSSPPAKNVTYAAQQLVKRVTANHWEKVYEDACNAVNVAMWKGILDAERTCYGFSDVGPQGQTGRLWVCIFEGDFFEAQRNGKVDWFDAYDVISGTAPLKVIRGDSEDLG